MKQARFENLKPGTAVYFTAYTGDTEFIPATVVKTYGEDGVHVKPLPGETRPESYVPVRCVFER